MVWMLSNQRINRIFVLNDSQSTAGLNARHRKKLFECLPDPVATHLLVKCEARSSPSWLPGKRGRFAFVLLGSLSRRKGLYLLAESIRQMPVDVQRRAIFVFAGAPPLDERDEVIAVLKELENHSEAEVVHKTDGFISDEVWWALLRFSDWVLLPYTRRDASSGVLGHAALAKRPVLVNAGGVVGELTSSYNLGHVIAGAKPEEWSDALTDIVAGKIKFTLHSRGREYVMERDPEAFARRIYESTGRN